MSQSTPRRSAAWMLDQIIGEGRLLSELIGAGALDRLEPADRARAQRLTLDVLRSMERADRVLQKHLRKPPPLSVQNVLRLGTLELCTGGNAHGIVNECVAIVGADKWTAAMMGLTNAVLRKVAATGTEHWDALRIPRLPKWLRGPMVEAWGPEAVLGMEAAQYAGAPLDLSAKTDAAAVATAVGGDILPTGSVRLKDAGQVTALAGFAEGDWWVQDAAAALPALMLNAKAGEKVLDLCAAPGGKTMQLAATGADVTALDISPSRMARVEQNLKRVGLNATLITADALEHEGQYDAILLDAPCSATGTMRRHADLPYAKDGSEFGALIALQEELIDHALTLLKPGGRLVFCTCSLLPDEGEVQIDEALERHAGLKVVEVSDLPGVDPEWRTAEGGIRLRPDYWPDLGGMDGFYMACLTR